MSWTRQRAARRNWAGNVAFGATELVRPTSVAELQAVVRRQPRARAVGAAHCFNDLPDSPGVQISLAELPPVVEVDSTARTALVAGGQRYAEVARRIDRHGFALQNLGSLPHVTVAGACATGTHGSGVANQSLSAAVSGMEMVTADGELLSIDRTTDRDGLEGGVVALGSLGVVVALTLDLVPSFDVCTRVYEMLDLDVLADHFAELVSAAYSVCLVTDWRAPRLTQVWMMQLSTEPEPAAVAAPWFDATPADGPRHPVAGMSAANCVQQQGVPGRWYERLPHFRPEFTPSSGRELQSEYLLPSADAVPALLALDGVRDRIHPVLQICEVRTVAADRLWLSPAYGRDSVSIHFTWIEDPAAVLPVVTLVEETLAPYSARPHWGKVFTTPAQAVPPLYPRFADFCQLVDKYDPDGKFANAYTDRYLRPAARDPRPGHAQDDQGSRLGGSINSVHEEQSR
jgi:xylitol oxidase